MMDKDKEKVKVEPNPPHVKVEPNPPRRKVEPNPPHVVKEMAKILEDAGLDPGYWIEHFKSIGATTPVALQKFCGPEHFKTLSKFAKTPIEKIALRKFLKMPDSESYSTNDEQEMARMLQEAGLDPKYWLKHFKNIGATTLATLKLCGPENFAELSKFTKKRPQLERKALKVFLKMKSPFGEKQKKEREENLKKTKEITESLRTALKQQKSRHDEAVKKLENHLLQALDISPEDWIAPGADLSTLLTELELFETTLSGTLSDRSDLNEVELIERVSEGRMLHGINKLDGSLSNNILLRAHDLIMLRGANGQTETNYATFTSKHQEDSFTRNMNKFGIGFSMAVSGGGFGVTAEASASASYEKENQESHKHNKESTYLSTLKTSIVPLASCSFDDTDFVLSDGALSSLQGIEKLILAKSPDVEIRIACENFFDKFGSCVNRGTYTLGGIYWLKSFSEGFKETEMDEIKKLHSFSLSASLSASASFSGVSAGAKAEGHVNYSTASYEGKSIEDIRKKVRMENGQIGGPPEVTSLPQWKSGLITNNSTWKIIEQDTNPSHLVYIWEILEINHSADFEDVQSISQVLCRFWEDVRRNQKWQQFLSQNKEAKKFLQNVKLWNSSKNKSKCIENLQDLAKVKNDIKTTNLWCEFYLNQLPIQYYLWWVIDVAKDEQCSSSTSEAIRVTLQQILEYSELVQIQHFPDQKFISQWLWPSDQAMKLDIDAICTDLPSFLSFLQKVIEIIHSNEIRGHQTQSPSELVTVAVNGLHLQEGSYDKLLLLTLLLPLNYDCQNAYFRSELTVRHLNFLRDKLNEVLQVKHEDGLHAQAYLLLQALNTLSGLEFPVTTYDTASHIKYLMNNVSNPETSIQNEVIKCGQQSQFNFRRLKLFLILKTNQQIAPNVDEEDWIEEIPVRPESPLQNEIIVNSANLKYFEDLGFLQYYNTQKLTLQDALAIDGHGLATKTTTYDPHELLHIMLERMKMSNYNCRKVLLYGKKKDEDNMKEVGVVDDSDDDSDDESDGESEDDNENADDGDHDDDNVNSTEEYEIVIHPMDGLLTLIHCADNFLRQDMYVKLKTSQLAVPLLLPDPVSGTITFPLWALRSIVRNWKVKTSPSSSVSHEGRVVDCEIPLISFFRFSHPGSYSKSQILNKVIGDSKNTCFFNYECDGSSAKRQFVDGLVEANWYLPSGEDSDLFNDVITFVNLRGNASKHEQQLAFLSSYSCMNFIFLKKEDIKTHKKEISHLKSAEGKVVFLMKTCSKQKRSKLRKLVPHCDIVSLSKQKEPAAIVKCIQEKITKLLASSKPKQVFRLSEIEFDGFGIITDEKNVKSCQDAKKLALEIMETIKSIPISEVKNQMVPLQGYDLWCTWAAINKTQNRMRPEDLGEMGLEKFHKSKRKEKESIRREQLKKANKYSPVMSVFINVLLNESTEVRAYFLEWLKIYLDDHSRKVLPKVQQKCKHLREKLRKATNEEEAKKIREDLVKQDKALIDASFGVEHFFRELAQIYECTMELQSEVEASKLREAKMFPKDAAQLLLKGYPLEIVDGDAAHIPMEWIKAVLESIKGHIKNSKMFVLSVLGIQSTGKSTLMNTLFGVRFAVSAGRCTRGAYFQLMKLNTKCGGAKSDYMLVIDTEGLRAPELDAQHTQQHDNELATLVIGLAGATIINIFGEVPADINDILQTSVHAFLRMKQVDLKPSCQFVRHHVSNVSASKSNEGSQRFQKTLDDMTVWAAKAEHCVGKYTQFSDVISFSNETDVQNFPSLWEGNPPMAPVNPAYCEAAQKLKSKFIEMSMSSGTLCTVDEFKRRVTTLWEAIIKENYVFSFKNTLEVEAYTVVDAEYSKWKWNLQNHMLEEETKAKNKITSSSDADVHSIENNLVMKFIDSLESEFDKTMEAAKKFFEDPNSSLAPIMVQWRGRYEAKLNNLKEDNRRKFKMFCSDLIQKRHDKTKLDELKGSLRSDINEQIKDLVSKMNIDKDKGLTEKELSTAERKFNQKWDKWMSDVGKKHSPLKRKDLDTLILICIKSDCQLDKYDKLINSELTKLPLQDRGQPLQLVIDQKKHLQFRFLNNLISTESGIQNDMKKARDMTSKLISEVKKYFSKDVSYASHNVHIQYIVNYIRGQIDDFDMRGGKYYVGKDEHHHFTFTEQYRVDIILEAVGYALKVFNKQQDRAIEDHPLTYLQSMKSTYMMSFKSLCTATAREKTSAMCLVELIARQLKLSLQEKLVVSLANDVRSNNVVFASKQKLKGQILLKLLEKKDFNLYTWYLTNISQSYLQWIKEYIEEHCKTQGRSSKFKIVELAKTELEFIIVQVVSAANCALKSSAGVKQWLTLLQVHLKEMLPLNVKELHDVVQLQEDSDLQFFTDEFIKGINGYKGEYLSDFEKLEQSTVTNFTKLINEVAEIVRESVAGCCEQCPFCKEQCERTDSTHESKHYCTLHRPMCLGNYRDDKTKVMIVNICTESVSSDGAFKCVDTDDKWFDYKDYQKIYPDWDIPKEGGKSAPYWKWFTAQYKKDIVHFFDMSNDVSVIPSDWMHLTPKDARNDVKDI